MKSIIRNGAIEFYDFDKHIGTLELNSVRNDTLAYCYTATADGVHYADKPAVDWFVNYENRLIEPHETSSNMVWEGLLRKDIGHAVAVNKDNGSIDIMCGNDTPITLVPDCGKYGLGAYKFLESRLTELSVTQHKRGKTKSVAGALKSILRDLYPNHQITDRGLFLCTPCEQTVPTLDTVTVTGLNVGQWEVSTNDTDDCVMLLKEEVTETRSGAELCLEVAVSARYEVSDEFVSAVYSQVLGSSASLDKLDESCVQRSYFVDSAYRHHILEDEICPKIDSNIIDTLNAKGSGEQTVSLLAMLPSVSYMYEGCDYVLMPLPISVSSDPSGIPVTVQIVGSANVISGWIHEPGTLIMYRTDAEAIGVSPIQLTTNSHIHYGQVLLGLHAARKHWATLVDLIAVRDRRSGARDVVRGATESILSRGSRRHSSYDRR